MKRKRVSDAILDQLTKQLDLGGRGTRARIQRSLEVSDQFLRRWEKRLVKLDLDKLEEVLAYLETDPVEFFNEALSSPGDGANPSPLAARSSEWVSRIRRVLGNDEPRAKGAADRDATAPAWFQRLEDVRYSSPKKAIEETGRLLERRQLSRPDAGFLCANLGSALRAVCQYEEAEAVFSEGLATVVGDPRLTLSLMHRLAVMYGEWGRLADARRVAGEGLFMCLVQRDSGGIGKFLLSYASWYYNEGQLAESKQTVASALEWLPKNESRYQLSATIALGLVERGLGNLTAAADCIGRAEPLARQSGKIFEWSVCWVKAEIWSESGLFDEAAREFERLLDGYRQEGMLLDAVIACVEAVSNLLRGRRYKRAQALAGASIWMVAELKGNRMAQSAVIDLVCSASEAGRLQIKAIDEIRARIEAAREKAGLSQRPGLEMGL